MALQKVEAASQMEGLYSWNTASPSPLPQPRPAMDAADSCTAMWVFLKLLNSVL